MARPWVLHVDLDEFIAAVEVLRRPELAGKPVVVGGSGDPTERGVVATASYAAREYGVGSGMPLRTAARRCPDAVFLPVDKPAYERVSEQVMAILRSFGVVEVLGWDEAFLAGGADDPEDLARAIQQAVLAGTALHASVGIGDNKLRAKLATGFGKPRGVFRLTVENWYDVMGDRSTSALWGIGSKTAKRLAGLGIETVRDLAAADSSALAESLGPTLGPWYVMLGRGLSSANVDGTPYVARGKSRETTFQQDLADPDQVRAEVLRLASDLADDVATDGRPVQRLTLKVRYVPFDTRTHSRKLPAPVAGRQQIADAVLELAARLDPSRPVRLLGLRAEFVSGSR